MTVEGADRLQGRLKKLAAAMKRRQGEALLRNGDELVAVARVLVPVKSGKARSEIKGGMVDEGAYLADFGPKAKVIEGDRGPRPFVVPAVSYTRKRRSARFRRAARQAMKDVFDGG